MASKVLVIGAGGVSNVAVQKMARLTEVFSQVMIASRTQYKCDDIAALVNSEHVHTCQLNADVVEDTVKVIEAFKPQLVVNLALPYQDLAIMEACLATKVHYLDTANYEPIDQAKFEYSWQWAYHDKFKEAGIMALLGCGFDPGVTQVFTAYANKHHFDEIHYLDIIDCNAGDHGKAFATNFNPEINIREITQKGKYYENGTWVEVPSLSIKKEIDYPGIGFRSSYLMYHEELESLVKNFPSIKRARFWMTFGDEYLKHLEVMQNIGITSIKPIHYQGLEIVPLQFLKALLPEPSSLGEGYTGETSIGCQIKGVKDGRQVTYYIWNNCKHQDAFQDVKGQGVAYTTGVPAMIGAKMMMTGQWMKPGVHNVESFDPDPFMENLTHYGLPWQQEINGKLAF